MKRTRGSASLITCVGLALLGVASTASAALFGFTPMTEMAWSNVAKMVKAAFSPADIMFIAMLVHARRSGVLR